MRHIKFTLSACVVLIVGILTIAVLVAAWKTFVTGANIFLTVLFCSLILVVVSASIAGSIMLFVTATRMLVDLRYVRPGKYGNVQAIRHRDGYQEIGIVQTSPHTLTINQTSPQGLLPSPTNVLPLAPSFRSITHQIREGRLILGFNSEGAIYGDVGDLLSMGIVGKPGTGKSSALLYYLAMLMLVDASVYVLDPHGSLNELADYLDYSDDLNEIARIVPALHEEIDERLALWKHGKQIKKPLLVLIDELPVISRWEQKNKPDYSTLELVERIVLECRKLNCFVILSGQSLPAEVLPTLTRDNLSSRIVFNSSGLHARMIGLDEESRKKLLPLLKRAQPGTAILDVSRRVEPDIVSLPYTTIDDLREIVNDKPDELSGMFEESFNEPVNGFQEVSELSRETPSKGIHTIVTGKLINDMKADGKGDESIPGYSREVAEEIKRIARTQLASYGRVIRSKIPAAMDPPRNNSIYPVVKKVLDAEGL